jgi:TolB-like protein/Flp pilus assembly protein TadD
MQSIRAAEQIREQLDRILSSVAFVRNGRLSRFLRFVVQQHLDGKTDEIKESLVGIEVFGRTPGYDTRSDSVVRTEAAKLRTRLSEYYAGEGASDPVVIELPKGGYTPVFHHREAVREIAAIASKGTLLCHGKGRWGLAAFAGATLLLAAIGLWRLARQSAPIPIAVLPLVNLDQDASNDYFADGLTDEIIRNLSILDGLAVRSQTSSFAFKGKARDVREAGKLLDVEYILEGSVLRAGQQLRINVQLVRVRDDSPLWSGRYDQEISDVFAIQDEISRGIVNSLRLKLGRGRRRYETSTEAYDLYLRASSLEIEQSIMGVMGYDQSIGPFQQVIAKDPSFAPAYAGLAMAYAWRSGRPMFDAAEEMTKMRLAAEKAIQLDPLSSEAYTALGALYARQAQWGQAEKSFRRALELEPNRSFTRQQFAMYVLLPLGRVDEAVQQGRLAEKSDPLASHVHAFFSYMLISAHRFDEAVAHCAKVLPSERVLGQCLGRIRLGQGRIEEAIRFFTTNPDPAEPGAFLGHALARAGRHDEAEKLAAGSTNLFTQALIFAGLGDKERTLEALDHMTVLGPVRIGRTLTFPELDLIRGDPRVKALRKKVGLPE